MTATAIARTPSDLTSAGLLHLHQAGPTVPSALRERARAPVHPHDPVPLRALAAELPGRFVEALTRTGSPTEVLAGVTRSARGSITRPVTAPVAAGGRTWAALERSQA